MSNEDQVSSKRKWLVLVAMVFGLFMPMLDNLVVNVALPTIQRTLDADVSALQWIIDAYTLTFASFMLTGGSLGDLYGRKRFFLGGLLLFTLASAACGLSASTDQLIAFRAIQGLGAALLLPGSLSIITATFHGKERGAAIGIWAAMSGLAVAVGPLVGGYLVEHVSWESIFFINIPVGIIGFILTAIVVRESRDESKSRRIDLPGLVTGTASLFFLVYALIEGNTRGWTDDLILGSFGLSAVLMVAFLLIESQRSSPMLPLAFFRNSTFAASNVVAAVLFFALFGTTFFLALYLQNVRGFSPFEAGVRLFPFTAAILVFSPLSGRLSDRYGSRWLMTFGTLVAAAGMGLLLRTQPDSSYVEVILPAFLVLGSGMATVMAPMTSAVMGSVHPRHAGVASAATNTTRELGGVLGIALLGAIVTSNFRERFMDALLNEGLPRPLARSILEDAPSQAAAGGGSLEGFREQAPPGVSNEVVEGIFTAAQQAFVDSIHRGMLVAIGFMLLASIVAAVFVRSHVADGTEDEVDIEEQDFEAQTWVEPEDKAESGVIAEPPIVEEEPWAPRVTSPVPVVEAPLADVFYDPQEAVIYDPQEAVIDDEPAEDVAEVTAPAETLTALLAELPFKAGTGSIQKNLEEIAQAAAGVVEASRSRSRELRRFSPDYSEPSQTDPYDGMDLSAISGYLRLEQRFGRVSPKASADLAASLLIRLAATSGLAPPANGGADADGRDGFIKGAVKVILEGIAPADGKAIGAGRKSSQQADELPPAGRTNNKAPKPKAPSAARSRRPEKS